MRTNILGHPRNVQQPSIITRNGERSRADVYPIETRVDLRGNLGSTIRPPRFISLSLLRLVAVGALRTSISPFAQKWRTDLIARSDLTRPKKKKDIKSGSICAGKSDSNRVREKIFPLETRKSKSEQWEKKKRERLVWPHSGAVGVTAGWQERSCARPSGAWSRRSASGAPPGSGAARGPWPS